MRLDRLELELRRRTPWEALDLGMGMVRRWALPVYRVWFVFVFVPALLMLLILPKNGWSWFVVWWLKPAADRLLLKVFSEASFGAAPTVKQVWQSLPELLRRSGLFGELTWRRLSFHRSFILPMLQLEGQRGMAFRKRSRILGRKTQGYAVWLTQACACAMTLLGVGLLILALWLTPGDLMDVLTQLDALMKNGKPTFWFFFLMMTWLMAETLVEPFYVAAGFSLYLNRRSDLEGWDIELAFRHMQAERARAQATPSFARRNKGLSSALLFFLLIGVAAQPFAAHAEEAPLEEPVRVEGEARRQALAVLAEPDFGSIKETTRWRWRNKRQDGTEYKKTRETRETHAWTGWRALLRALSEGMRVLLYGLMILALAVCVVFFYRHRERFWPDALPQESRRPETLFGLDLRPEALPVDIPAAALAEAEAGHWVAALSLLYRGALVTLIERDRVVFRTGDTEDLCLVRVRGHVQGEVLTVFAALLLDWKAAAYAGKPPTLVRMHTLCAAWRAHFAAGKVGGAA
jgi:hypothetical protein